MINVSLPHIVVEKVENGFIVVWQRKLTDEERKQSSNQYKQVSKIASTQKQLLAVIKEASESLA